MNDQTRLNDGLKAIVALITSLITGASSYIGLPDVITVELVNLVAAAISACAAVYFYIRRKADPVAEAPPAA